MQKKIYYKHIDVFGIYYTNTSDPYSIYHREDGPACEYANGDKCWFLNGKRHRIGGPACEYINGDSMWYYKGTHIPFKDNLKLLKKK